ncbi:MAG: DNA repair protein RadC [Armatimonadetes bacterium]|nr:DNA repair protein RadC [Armatimonadota bacterium]
MGSDVVSRIQAVGLKGADAQLLLAVCLAKNEEDIDFAEDRAREVFRRTQLIGIADLAKLDFTSNSELSEFEVFRTLCAIALGRKVGLAGKNPIPTTISTAEDAWAAFADLAFETREHFCALFLDSRNGIIARKTIHIGTLNMSPVGVREVFREAVRENASTIIVAHNHPSGDPSPSMDDIDVTHRLAEAGDLLDIVLRDHIIIGHGKFVSLKRQGVI